MKTAPWLLFIGSLFALSCSVPRPSLEPAPLVDTKTDGDSETSKDEQPESEPEIPACDGDPDCNEACRSQPAEKVDDCVAAFRAGCFSERPPAESDCEEFGEEPSPSTTPIEEQTNEDEDGAQIEGSTTEERDEDQFLDIPEHD